MGPNVQVVGRSLPRSTVEPCYLPMERRYVITPEQVLAAVDENSSAWWRFWAPPIPVNSNPSRDLAPRWDKLAAGGGVTSWYTS